jgi:DNA polymerase alpha subunit A
MSEVYSDFDHVRQRASIKSWRGKFVKRRYAFGETDVPREETEWLKVVYPFEGNYHYNYLLIGLR